MLTGAQIVLPNTVMVVVPWQRQLYAFVMHAFLWVTGPFLIRHLIRLNFRQRRRYAQVYVRLDPKASRDTDLPLTSQLCC